MRANGEGEWHKESTHTPSTREVMIINTVTHTHKTHAHTHLCTYTNPQPVLHWGIFLSRAHFARIHLTFSIVARIDVPRRRRCHPRSIYRLRSEELARAWAQRAIAVATKWWCAIDMMPNAAMICVCAVWLNGERLPANSGINREWSVICCSVVPAKGTLHYSDISIHATSIINNKNIHKVPTNQLKSVNLIKICIMQS